MYYSFTVVHLDTSEVAPLNISTLPCQDGFFRPDDSDICVANCYTWSQYTEFVVIAADVFILLSAIMGFIAAMAALIISFIRFKKM